MHFYCIHKQQLTITFGTKQLKYEEFHSYCKFYWNFYPGSVYIKSIYIEISRLILSVYITSILSTYEMLNCSMPVKWRPVSHCSYQTELGDISTLCPIQSSKQFVRWRKRWEGEGWWLQMWICVCVQVIWTVMCSNEWNYIWKSHLFYRTSRGHMYCLEVL